MQSFFNVNDKTGEIYSPYWDPCNHQSVVKKTTPKIRFKRHDHEISSDMAYRFPKSFSNNYMYVDVFGRWDEPCVIGC